MSITATQVMDRPFRWGSALGIATILFLLVSAQNILFALFVPFSLHTGGYAALGGLIWGTMADSALLGRAFDQIGRSDPAMGTYLVLFMDTMCAMMMGYGIALVAVIWFGLRRAARWALWTAIVASLVPFLYYVVIFNGFVSAGVAASMVLSEMLTMFFAVSIVAIVVAAILGWLGVRSSEVAAA